MTLRLLFSLAILALALSTPPARSATFDHRVLATTRTSTMEKEMNQAADAGYVFADVMGGETAMGGKEVVVVMVKSSEDHAKRTYKLLATSRTSTMQKELQQLGEEGFVYQGQTVFQSALGGREVVIIMERDLSRPAHKIDYRLLATSRTSTMAKELREAGDAGYRLLGMTVAKTSFAGSEIVCIMRKRQD
jgi:hypothetical protein